jgi:hypothetical protein
VHCGALVDAFAISPLKPVNGFSLTNVSGDCTKGIALANITGAELHDISVTGYAGALITQTNVQGSGLVAP